MIAKIERITSAIEEKIGVRAVSATLVFECPKCKNRWGVKTAIGSLPSGWFLCHHCGGDIELVEAIEKAKGA